MHKQKTLCALAVLLFLASAAHATLWYVHPDSVQNCIQDCLNMCCSGDTVLVGPGTYYENIVWPDTQGIKLMSEMGAASTVIDGDSAGRVIAIARPMDTTTQITGFTIQNGYTLNDGGGIMLYNASPLIADNIITTNHSTDGGGIYLYHSHAVIRNNTVINNFGEDYGGGIRPYEYSAARIYNNLIMHNTADPVMLGWGGGIYCGWGDTSYVAYNTISMNTAFGAGGVGCYNGCRTRIIRNTISNNSAAFGAGIYCGDESHVTIHKNTIAGNDLHGIECLEESSPFIDSCRIANNTGTGVRIMELSNPVLYCNNICGNGFGVSNPGPGTIDADSNWWGDSSGPYHPDSNAGGLGDTVSDNVDFDPWLTDSMEWLAVEEHKPEEATLGHMMVCPNPFSDAVSITFGVDSRQYGVGSIQIYDITGRLVKSFGSLPHAPSPMHILWDGTDHANRPLPSGVYLLRLQGGEYSRTAKLLLIR